MRLICDESSMATYKFLEVVGGSLSDGVDVINEPGHTEPIQLLVEEVNSQLSWKKNYKYLFCEKFNNVFFYLICIYFTMTK